MLLNLAALLALAPVCAPAVAPPTLLSVAQVESGFDPLAIGVNGPRPQRLTFANLPAAAKAARTLIAAGQNIDLGLGQINVRNLASLGLSVEDAFDPCRNLAASARVLQAGYDRAAPEAGGEQTGLRTALSLYNTGHRERGLTNGYVAKVTAAASRLVPAIATADAPRPAGPPIAAWDVFGHADFGARDRFVLQPTTGADK
jgi:type IV secretion system protein VirB1